MGAIHASNFTEELYRRVNTGILRGNYLRDHVLDYSADKTEREYNILDRRSRGVVSFRARPLPGCCGILVVYYLRPDRNSKDAQKVFTDTLNLIVEAAGGAKYGAVLLTQTVDSAGHRALSEAAAGPAVTCRFVNFKTGNEIVTYTIATKAPVEEAKKAAFSSE